LDQSSFVGDEGETLFQQACNRLQGEAFEQLSTSVAMRKKNYEQKCHLDLWLEQ
jgi:hypothetical protein